MSVFACLDWRRVGAILGLIFLSTTLNVPEASALPLFARQTGQQCAACHNGFPELTPYGRLFKMNGYTFGGGQSSLPPVSTMVVGSFTKTQKDQAGGAAPHYAANDNASLDTISLFYGGALTSHIGAFVQGTYDNDGRAFTWDNVDIRFANTTELLGKETVFGVSANNNPTMSDVWNTTPAWGYPYLSSGLAPTPAASTLIEGTYAQQVAGLSAYTFWNSLVYAEIGGYSTLTKGMDSALGVNPAGTTSFRGLAPYWRLALQPAWGSNTLEIGTFGMAATLNPGRVTGSGVDHAVDIGFDTQYQYMTPTDSFSAQASYIIENQSLGGSQAMGLATSGRENLRSLHVKGTYYYDQTYGATLGYFRLQGGSESGLFSADAANGSPDSSGYSAEVNYIPFNHGGPDTWPWLNVKLGLQYVYYDKFNGSRTNFDGAGGNAVDNNTVFTYAWFAF